MLLKIRNKLHSRSGVSIIFGLLAFLIATVISTVIISAALSAFKTAYTAGDMTKGRLAVSSAAKLAAKDMEGTVYTIETSTVTKDDTVYIPESKTEEISTGDFSSYIKAAIDSMRTYGTSGDTAGAFYLKTYDGSDLMGSVKVTYSLDPSPYYDDDDEKGYYFYISLEDEDRDIYTTVTYVIKYTKEESVSDYTVTDEDGDGITADKTVTTETYSLISYTIF